MAESVSSQCRGCVVTLKNIISILSSPPKLQGRIYDENVINELERFSLWAGNIGALHEPKSPMSLETRLSEASDVLDYILESIYDLKLAAKERETSILYCS